MKTKGIGETLKAVLDGAGPGGKKQKNALKKILRKLKKRDIALTRKLEEAKDDKAGKGLRAKLKINRAHRKKGLKALANLKHRK